MHYTLNIRLTKSCNADCDYCSSFDVDEKSYMSKDDVVGSIEYLFKTVLPAQRITPTAVTIQYVGGEVLTIPTDTLNTIVNSVRYFFAELNISIVDGVQTNLIGSNRRVSNLITLFNGRVGSTIETVTDKRTISNSAQGFKDIWNDRVSLLPRNGNSGLIFTVDHDTSRHAQAEYKASCDLNLPITYRPVFEGGKSVEKLSASDYTSILLDTLSKWFMSTKPAVEPLLDMIKSRITSHSMSHCSSCNRQSDCAKRGMNIEPNGDLYTCLEMADSGVYKLGNGISKTFNTNTWSKIALRDAVISRECGACPYFTSCKGGCLIESEQAGMGMYSKTPYCSTYINVFSEIDRLIEEHGASDVKKWLGTYNLNQHAAVY